VFIAPIFAALTAIVSYLMTVQITKRTEDGLVAAFFISIVPSYMSRSVAGSYDNEGVSIFALVFTFYLWLKASNTGSILWSLIASLGMFYMVASWGGYAFIINIIPIFVLFCLITDRFTMKLYVSYNVFYIMSTILAMQIPFVNFNAIESSEHMASHGVFFILQVYMIIGFIKLYVNEQIFKRLAKTFLIGFVTLILVAILFMFITGKTQWSGRSMTLLDPTYAKKYIPIIASVSEH
jgi:dolichyl-diphosphooligosaccharide--protein glycosyltransferase